MVSKRKWYKHNTHTGWRKRDPAGVRRKKLLASTDGRMNLYDRFLKAARRSQALANVTTDPETSLKAKIDADHFFSRARAMKQTIGGEI